MISSFSLVLFGAVLLASFLVWRQTRRAGLSEERVLDIFILTLLGALVGGRLVYGWQHQEVFILDPVRLLLLIRYPGLSFEGALTAGIITAGLAAALFKLDGLLILDFFALAFSWAFPLGLAARPLWGLILAQAAVALFLWWLQNRIRSNPDLMDLARRPGLFVSAYLIFFSLSFLILERKNFYLILFPVAAGFFLWRYGKFLRMVKFPPNILSQIQKYLENKRRVTEEQIKELKTEDPFEDKSRLLDRASDDTEAQNKAGHERVAAMQQQMNLILIQTRKALSKIKIGKYGICENCSQMIDTDRLAAMPSATLCLSCEKKREK